MFFFHLLSRSPEALYKDREGQHFWWGNILEPWQAHPENRPVEPVPNEAIYAPWRQSLWSLQEPTLTWRRKVPMITCVSEFFRRVSDSFLHINFNEVNISCIHSRSFTVRPWKVSETQKKAGPSSNHRGCRATKPQRVHELLIDQELLKSKGCQFGFHNGDLDLKWAMR